MGTARHKALLKAIEDLSARLHAAMSAFDEREQRIASLEAKMAPVKYIRNHASGTWYYTREHCAGRMCYTACGWTYLGAQPPMFQPILHTSFCVAPAYQNGALSFWQLHA